jgi:hypothetical protein
MTRIAPDIFRKRLLIEGFYTIEIGDKNSSITSHTSRKSCRFEHRESR